MISKVVALFFNVLTFVPSRLLRLCKTTRAALFGYDLEDKVIDQFCGTKRRRRRLLSLNSSSQVVLITGASSGIGRALAHKLYEQNCRLILCSRNEEALNEVKQELIHSNKSNVG